MNRITFQLLLLLLMVVWSCEQEGDVAISRPEPTPSTANEASLSSCQQATASQIQALKEFNYSFKGKFKSIKLEQVEGLSRHQFKQLLKASKIAFIEKDLLPVLSAKDTEYVLLRKVRLQGTGKLATVALISVPRELHEEFKPVIAIVSQHGDITRRSKACFSRVLIPSRQSKSSDLMTLCMTWVSFISAYGSCPPDECVGESPRVEPPVKKAIAAF